MLEESICIAPPRTSAGQAEWHPSPGVSPLADGRLLRGCGVLVGRCSPEGDAVCEKQQARDIARGTDPDDACVCRSALPPDRLPDPTPLCSASDSQPISHMAPDSNLVYCIPPMLRQPMANRVTALVRGPATCSWIRCRSVVGRRADTDSGSNKEVQTLSLAHVAQFARLDEGGPVQGDELRDPRTT